MKLAVRARLLLLALCGALACGPACQPAVPILTWHSISDSGEPYAVSPAHFAAQLDWLAAHGFSTVSLHELFEHLDNGAPLPARPVVLTFDDGYADAWQTALPLLQSRSQKATFFVVTGFLGDDEAHRHIVDKGTPQEQRYLLWSEVKSLEAAGMEIGSHSQSHRRLPDLPQSELFADVTASRQSLAAHLGSPAEFFAYPFNSKRGEARAAVREAGFRGAVAGVNGSRDRFQLGRIGVYHGTTLAELQAELLR